MLCDQAQEMFGPNYRESSDAAFGDRDEIYVLLLELFDGGNGGLRLILASSSAHYASLDVILVEVIPYRRRPSFIELAFLDHLTDLVRPPWSPLLSLRAGAMS